MRRVIVMYDRSCSGGEVVVSTHHWQFAVRSVGSHVSSRPCTRVHVRRSVVVVVL